MKRRPGRDVAARFCSLDKLVGLAVVAALCSADLAVAHRSASGPLPPGIVIPSLTHGQMRIMARYRAEILDLAGRETVTDPDFRRLLNYGNLEFAYCMWGIMPGSIIDEASPFNECSHAYLAATRSLLDHMQTMPKGADEAFRLRMKIDTEMVREGAAWELCEYSSEPFSTGQFILPDWGKVIFHWPSLLASLAMLIALLLAVTALFRWAANADPGKRIQTAVPRAI